MKEKRIKIIVFTILAIIIIFLVIYLNTYYKAEKNVKDYLKSNELIKVTKNDNYYFFDGPSASRAFIFYPGAKVEYTSYAPLLYNLASDGIDSFLIKMPFNLAILDKNAADKILENYKYKEWYIGGHSLGGAVSSMYVSNNSDKINGLILLAAYSNVKLPDTIKVLSIYGTHDGVLNMNKYKENKKNISNIKEEIIYGANHSQFGYYGFQSGDKKALISREEQQNIIIKTIIDFIN